MLVPFLKSVYSILLVASLVLCYGSTQPTYYLMMLLVVAETVTRTAIAVILFLISKVSLMRLSYTFFTGLGYS